MEGTNRTHRSEYEQGREKREEKSRMNGEINKRGKKTPEVRK